MLKLKLHTIAFAFISLFLLSGLFLIFSLRQRPHLDLKDTSAQRIYNVSPQVYPAIIPIGYPHVSTPPSSVIKYAITSLREKKDLWDNSFNSLFFAAKRVEEMSTWKDELVIHGNVSHLGEWWSANEPSITRPDSFYIYQTWEAQLARYHSSMTEALKNRDTYEYSSDKNSSHLPRYVVTFENRIQLSVRQAKLNDHEKTYLLSLVDAIHKDIYNKLQYNPQLFINSQIPYNLTNIIQDKQFGIYNIRIPITANSTSTPQALIIDKQAYPIHCDKLNCTAENIPIDYDHSQLFLQYDHRFSQLELVQDKEYSTFTIPVKENYQSALIISNTSGQEFKLEISQQSDQEKKTLYQMTFPESSNDTTAYFIEIPSGEKQLEGTLYAINPEADISVDDFSVSWTPQLTPKIHLSYQKPLPGEKLTVNLEFLGYNSYSIHAERLPIKQQHELLAYSPLWNIVSTSETEKGFRMTVRYWPTTILTFIFLFSLTVTIFFIVHLTLLKYNQTRYLQILSLILTCLITVIKAGVKHIGSFITKIKYLSLLISLSITMFLLLFVSFSSPFLMLSALLFWILTTTSFRLSSDYPFFFSYISLGIFLILILLQQWLFAESFALLSFTFFSVGVILGIAENLLSYRTIPFTKLFKTKFRPLK